MLKVGDRVANTRSGEIGHIETIDEDGFYEVRVLTPNNQPSCVLTITKLDDLVSVPDSVVPMKRSKAWWREAREFHSLIASVIRDL